MELGFLSWKYAPMRPTLEMRPHSWVPFHILDLRGEYPAGLSLAYSERTEGERYQRRQIYALALGSSFLLSHPHDSVLNSDLSESRANALLCGGATWGFPRQWEAPSLGDPHAGGGAASH